MIYLSEQGELTAVSGSGYANLKPIVNMDGISYYVQDAGGDVEIDGQMFHRRTDEEIMLLPVWADAVNRQADIVESYIDPASIRALFASEMTMVADEEIDDFVTLFPAWRVGESVEVDERRQYQGKVWKAVQAHTTQADWPPDVVPAIWTRVNNPAIIPAWVQPTGSVDAYPLGAKVIHNGHTWESIVNDNVWEPGVYGWVVV